MAKEMDEVEVDIKQFRFSIGFPYYNGAVDSHIRFRGITESTECLVLGVLKLS